MGRLGLNIVKIGQIGVASSSKERLLRKISQELSSRHKLFLVTPNPEFVVFAQENLWFKKILDKASLAVPDGAGLLLAAKVLGKPIKERITGTDLMVDLCRLAEKKGWPVYLLGGWPGVAEKALAGLKNRFPALEGFADSGPEIKNLKQSLKSDFWTRKINRKKPAFLFVGLGMGKQEKFIADNWPKLEVKLAMGVGGAFDYLAGEVARAPKWLRKLGFEWLYRLFKQPWRWKRQLVLVKFGWLVVKEKLSKSP